MTQGSQLPQGLPPVPWQEDSAVSPTLTEGLGCCCLVQLPSNLLFPNSVWGHEQGRADLAISIISPALQITTMVPPTQILQISELMIR